MGSPSGDEGEAVFEAVAGAVDADRRRSVQQSVEDGGEDVVAEDLTLSGEGLVAGEDHGAAFRLSAANLSG